MVELTKCIFYHIPKTGGSWVNCSLENACQVVKTISGHQDCTEYPKGNKKAFTFIRHPVAVYESSYNYERDIHDCKQVSNNWIFGKFSKLPFDRYVENMTTQYPGWLGQYYKEFTKGMDYVGYQENLKKDLTSILDYIGEPYNKKIISTIPDTNKGNYKSLMTSYTRKLIENSEKWLINTYYKDVTYGIR